MNDSIFRIAEIVTSPSQLLLTLLIYLLTGGIVGLMFSTIRESIRDSVIGFVLTVLMLLPLHFLLKDRVQTERLRRINEYMLEISPDSFDCESSNGLITNWQQGVKRIQDCPSEIGYYVKTADLLEKEGDYESAALLIELGLDFITFIDVPVVLCERLQRYYKKLDNRPELGEGCEKIHQL